jgi:hypothetical protein
VARQRFTISSRFPKEKHRSKSGKARRIPTAINAVVNEDNGTYLGHEHISGSAKTIGQGAVSTMQRADRYWKRWVRRTACKAFLTDFFD